MLQPSYPVPAPGGDVQLEWIVGFQNVITQLVSNGQGTTGSGYFMDPAYVLEGQTTQYDLQFGNGWTDRSTPGVTLNPYLLRQLISLPTVYKPDGSGGVIPIPIDVTLGHWLRRRPREITALDALIDIQGNTITVGMRAYAIAFGLDGIDPANYLYKCTAVGGGGATWVRDSSGPPDLLDNTVATPGSAIVPDPIPPGDYILWEAFEEARKAILKLSRVLINNGTFGSRVSGTWDNTNPYYTDGTDTTLGQNSIVSMADANSLSATAYAGAGSTAEGEATPAPLLQAYLQVTFLSDITNPFVGPQLWTAYANRSDAVYHAKKLTNAIKTITWFAYSTLNGSSFPPELNPNFDAQGDPVTNGTYHEWDSEAATPLDTVDSMKFGAVGTYPPNLPPDPGAGPPPPFSPVVNTAGYLMLELFAIADYPDLDSGSGYSDGYSGGFGGP